MPDPREWTPSLDLTGARIENPAGVALDLGNANIGGDMFVAGDKAGRRAIILGRLDMGSARISGQFLIRDAVLREPGNTTPPSSYDRSRRGGTTVRAPRLSVGVEVTFAGSTQVTGGLDLSMSDMSSLAVGSECTLRAPGRIVLDLTNANVRSSLTLSSHAIEGTVRLTGALVHGDLSLQGARLSAPASGSLLAAQGVSVDGDVLLRDLHATGGRLRFSRAVLGSVVASGAQLTNPGGQTLGLHQATVGGSVALTAGFSSDGLVMLSQSTVEGELECAGGSFTCPTPSQRNPQGNAIEAISATIRGGMDLSWAAISPSVDFTNATTTFLADNPETWPPRFVISGFSYDRFEQSRDSRLDLSWNQSARCAWLSRQAVHDRGSYEHAARVFRQHGYTGEAEAILIAQHKQVRRTTSVGRRFPRRVLDAIYGTTVGYGYRPGRVLWFLVALLVLVIASLEIPAAQATMRAATQAGSVYSTRGLLQAANAADPPLRHGGAETTTTTDVCGNGQVRCFSPVIYGIDTVIPLVSLDQRSTWYPDPYAPHGLLMQWWLNAATLLGWLLSSIFALSLARLARTI